jgi:hypothetical protein
MNEDKYGKALAGRLSMSRRWHGDMEIEALSVTESIVWMRQRMLEQ